MIKKNKQMTWENVNRDLEKLLNSLTIFLASKQNATSAKYASTFDKCAMSKYKDIKNYFYQTIKKILSEMRREKIGGGYDGNDLKSACDYYHCVFENWEAVIRLEDGFNQKHSEEGEYINEFFKNK